MKATRQIKEMFQLHRGFELMMKIYPTYEGNVSNHIGMLPKRVRKLCYVLRRCSYYTRKVSKKRRKDIPHIKKCVQPHRKVTYKSRKATLQIEEMFPLYKKSFKKKKERYPL